MQEELTSAVVLHQSVLDDPAARDHLVTKMSRIDSATVAEADLRAYFEALKTTLIVFAQKINSLESAVEHIKKAQKMSEARAESRWKTAQLEIRALREEVTQEKILKSGESGRRVIAAARKLGTSLLRDGEPIVPTTMSSFAERLSFAQNLGFRWNVNNREPSKPSRRLKALEAWEKEFSTAASVLTPSLALDYTAQVSTLGRGGVAAAIVILEQDLPASVLSSQAATERSSMSLFNSYQRTVKLYLEVTQPSLAPLPEYPPDLLTAIKEGFSGLTEETIVSITKRLESRKLTSTTQVVSAIKKILSKSVLPNFISWENAQREMSPTEQLYAIQAGEVDDQLGKYFEKCSTASKESP